MSTNIEWVRNPDGSKGETWPVVTGCTPVSEGCRNCYAARMAATRLKHHPRYKGLATIKDGKAKWTGEVRLNHDVLELPLRWRQPRMVFVVSMGDLFHESVSFGFIGDIWDVIASATQHTFQVLTKRPKQMHKFFREYWEPATDWELPLTNVWLGTSIENQAAADERREYLEQCPAAVKYVSYEPALGPVDWTGWEFVSQIISGGESGPGARPSHPDWHRATRDFCQENDVAYFFKQWGAWTPDAVQILECKPGDKRFAKVHGPGGKEIWMARVGKKCAGHLLDSREYQEFPRRK